MKHQLIAAGTGKAARHQKGLALFPGHRDGASLKCTKHARLLAANLHCTRSALIGTNGAGAVSAFDGGRHWFLGMATLAPTVTDEAGFAPTPRPVEQAIRAREALYRATPAALGIKERRDLV
jgi:hypothetical protein